MTVEAPPAPPPTGPLHIGPEGIPEENRTLGWQILAWTRKYLLQPDGPRAGEEFIFTNEQIRFLLWWYAIDDAGRFVYRAGMLRRMKGWGKDPFGAALCCIEFVGPCRFAGWDRNGNPVARDHPAAWIQTAAVSQEQTRNTMTLFPSMMSQRLISECGIDLGKTIIYAYRAARRIEAVASSPRALEGGRATFVLKNETHHWRDSNEGLAMSDVIARNVAKSRDGSSRVLAITNAHAPGELSDAEMDWEAHEKRETLGGPQDFLYDSLEAGPVPDLEDIHRLREGIIEARGDSDWLDVERLVAEIQDPRTSEAMARRFYLNQIVAEEDRPFNREKWDACYAPDHVVEDRALITLGFDGSVSHDWTALIATEITTGYQWPLGIWEPEWDAIQRAYLINVEAVDETVADAFRRFRVWRMYSDPFYWKSETAKWAGLYGKDVVVEWATNQYRRMAYALLDYQTAIHAGDLTHNGDAHFTAGIYNAHKHMQSFTDDNDEPMWVIRKERPDSDNKIDPAVAGALSWRAYMDAIADGVDIGDGPPRIRFF